MEQTIYLVTLVGTALVLAAAFSSLIAFRFGAPLLLLFLGIGLLAGVDGLGIEFDNARLAYFVGSLALAIILFDSGFGTPLAVAAAGRRARRCRWRRSASSLTAGLFGAAAFYLTDFTWLESFLLGAIVASTDAAAVFFLLRAGNLTSARPRALDAGGRIRHQRPDRHLPHHHAGRDHRRRRRAGRRRAADRPRRSASSRRWALGAVVGLLGGLAIVAAGRPAESRPGLLPIFVLTLALLVFAVAGAVGGSGFLAVYLAGLVAGNSAHRARRPTLKRFQDGMSWLAQIIMFLVLGLFATPSQFLAILPVGDRARPVPDLRRAADRGLALPAAVPLPARRRPPSSPGSACAARCRSCSPSRRCSAASRMAAPSSTSPSSSCWSRWWCRAGPIGPLARRLGLIVPQRIGPLDKVELELPGSAHHELLAYRVVAGQPGGARRAHPALGAALAGRARRPLDELPGCRAGCVAGDHVYIFVPDRYPRLLDRLFASRTRGRSRTTPTSSAPSPSIPTRPAAELEAAYGPASPRPKTKLTIGAADAAAAGRPRRICRPRDARHDRADRARRRREGPRSPRSACRSSRLPRDRQHPGLPQPGRTRRPASRGDLLRRPVKDSAGGRATKPTTSPMPTAAAAPEPRSSGLHPRRAAIMSGRLPVHKETRHGRTSGRSTTSATSRASACSSASTSTCPMADGKVTDATRIERVAPTILELSDKGAKVILLAHFGRPKDGPDPDLSLEPDRPRDCRHRRPQRGLSPPTASARWPQGAIFAMLPRRHPAAGKHPLPQGRGEERPGLRGRSSPPMATSTSTTPSPPPTARTASTEGLAHHPAGLCRPHHAGRARGAGEAASAIPDRPVVAIVGGAKVSTKIDLLMNLVKKVDALVIGGGMANTFLAARGDECRQVAVRARPRRRPPARS